MAINAGSLRRSRGTEYPACAEFTLAPAAVHGVLIAKVRANPLIHIHEETRLAETGGFVGNFTSRLRRANGEEQTIRHGAVIVATGAKEWRGDDYSLGRDPRVITQSEFVKRLAEWENPTSGGRPVPSSSCNASVPPINTAGGCVAPSHSKTSCA